MSGIETSVEREPSYDDDLSRVSIDQSEVERIRAQLELRLPFYKTAAKEAGFDLEFGAQTLLNHKSDPPTVVIGVEQLVSLGFSTIEKLNYAVLHELGHLYELREDPEGYLKVIEAAKAKGALQGLYFTLDNSLADIFVNNRTAAISPIYRDGKRSSAIVQEIYRENLFAERDFTTRPLCIQYADYLLNLGMDCGDDIQLSPEVQAEIDKGIRDFGGVTFTYHEYLKTFFTPPVGRAKGENNWRGTVSERTEIIERTIRPVFERLLKLDQEAGKDLTKQNQTGFGGMDFDPKDLEEMAKHAVKVNAKLPLTANEKRLEVIEQQLRGIGKENGLSDPVADDFAKTYRRVEPMIRELIELWKRIRNKEIAYKTIEQGHYKSGVSADINRAIDTFDLVENDPNNAEVMLRRSTEESIEKRARGIRVRLVLDVSGSIRDQLPMIKDVMVAVASSLSTVNKETAGTAREVKGELQVVTFGEKAQITIPLSGSISMADVAKAFDKFELQGDTNDHLALALVESGLKPDDSTKISEGDLVDVLIEVTDGDTAKPDQSRKLIDQIESKGVRAYAIRFPKNASFGLPEQLGNFNRVWNPDSKKRGFLLKQPSELTAKFYEILADVVDNFEETF